MHTPNPIDPIWVNVAQTQYWIDFTQYAWVEKNIGPPIKPKTVGCFDPVLVLFFILFLDYLPKLNLL